MKVNFALLLDKKTAKECENFSKELSKTHKSKFILGDRSLPHVSIVQTECEEEDLDSIWKEAQNVIQKEYEINFAGLNFLPSSSGDAWVEIQVLKSDAILQLQKSLLNLSSMKGRKIINGVEDDFRPHVTVGLLDKYQVINNVHLPKHPLRNSEVKARLSLGYVGSNYIFTKSIHTW